MGSLKDSTPDLSLYGVVESPEAGERTRANSTHPWNYMQAEERVCLPSAAHSVAGNSVVRNDVLEVPAQPTFSTSATLSHARGFPTRTALPTHQSSFYRSEQKVQGCSCWFYIMHHRCYRPQEVKIGSWREEMGEKNSSSSYAYASYS